MENEGKAVVLETYETGNLNHIEQRLRIEYLKGIGNITPKVIIGVATSGDGEQSPRSFRTDSPLRLREIIKCLIKSLHQLEVDTEATKKKAEGQPKLEHNLNDFDH